MEKNYVRLSMAFVMLLLLAAGMSAQTTVTYSYTGAMQQFTAPPCVSLLTITAIGGAGSGGNGTIGGKGASMRGTFTCTPGQVIKILAAGQGTNSNSTGSGAGGGTFVSDINNVAWIVAGGGGGTNGTPLSGTQDAPVTNSGLNGNSPAYPNNYGFGGTNGSGGTGNSACAGNGGGYSINGVQASCCSALGGTAYINGGQGSPGGCGLLCPGGYGGGGGGGSAGCGGGGGYSGGGASYHYPGNGGGGGSYNAGTNQLNAPGVSAGHGSVIISFFPGLPMTTTLTPALGICSGGTATLTAIAGMQSYTWSNNSNAQFITVSPGSTTSYTVQGTNPQGCITTAIITVTVSSGLPVLSISTSTNVTCLGKTVTLTATGAQSFTWSNNIQNGASYSPSVTNTYTVTGENGCGTSSAVTTITVAPIPITASTPQSTICASNAVTLTAAGAATGFTWTPFPSNLTGTQVIINPSVTTIYTVVASDGTCAGTATVMITAKPVPTISILATTSLVCEGYPVNLTANGGLSYTWFPGNQQGSNVTVNPTAPSVYSVIGTNSVGCTALATQILLTNPSPTLTIAANSTFVCAGSPVNITATGGSTYQWSNGPTTSSIIVNPLVSTGYTVVGTSQNNTCTASKTIDIVVYSPSFTVTGTSPICSGSNINLNASGADTYQWENGSNSNFISVSPTVSTVYSVTGTSFSNNITCSVIKTISITVNPKPVITAAASNSNICRNESIVLTGGGAGNYTWTGTSGVIGQTNPVTVTPSVPVQYVYTVTGVDANGCSNFATVQVKVNACTGIGEVSNDGLSFHVYPNPTKGEFTIEVGADLVVKIVNELGQVVKNISLNASNHHKVLISDLAPGIYFVKSATDGRELGPKIVVTK